jgi:hypothetical protein
MRLDQTDAAAQTLGPTIGGGLVGLVGALAIVIDAVSYLADAVLNATLRVEEPRAPRRPARLRTEIGEGCGGRTGIRCWASHRIDPRLVRRQRRGDDGAVALALRELGFSAPRTGCC